MGGVLGWRVNESTSTSIYVSASTVQCILCRLLRSRLLPANTASVVCRFTRRVVAEVEERVPRRLERHFASLEHGRRRTSRVAVAQVAITRRYARDVWRAEPVSSTQVPQVRLGACTAHRRGRVVVCRQRPVMSFWTQRHWKWNYLESKWGPARPCMNGNAFLVLRQSMILGDILLPISV